MSANPRLHTLSLQSYYIAEDNTTQVTQETTYTYDATDNIVADGTHTYTYDNRNRLIGVDDNITYQYNYDNKRVSKTVTGVTTYFIYEAHKLIGEYDSEGNVITEYLYNDNTPIAIITADGIYKIYADHLDTPRRVADSTNTIVWSWESKPFGEDEANGSITLNLRFPGQYFDAETKTHYNINRDYNPVTGRYIQSDPIGLDGGVSTFGYVGGNPIRLVDLLGLDWADYISNYEAKLFLLYTIRPTLERMGSSYNAVAYEQLLLGTALQESGVFKWRRQLGYGSASTEGGFGYYQMEKNTQDDLYIISKFTRETVDGYRNGQDRLYSLQYNDEYATAMARMKYFKRSGTVDDYDIYGQAWYRKMQYNSASGGGTVDQYIEKWENNVNDDMYGIWAH